MSLPEGRKPIDNSWFQTLLSSNNQNVKSMQESRCFPDNTCPATRHLQIMAEELLQTGNYPMLQEDPSHCASSIASVVSSLYQARTFLKSLGYSWTVENGETKWYMIEKKNTHE